MHTHELYHPPPLPSSFGNKHLSTYFPFVVSIVVSACVTEGGIETLLFLFKSLAYPDSPSNTYPPIKVVGHVVQNVF